MRTFSPGRALSFRWLYPLGFLAAILLAAPVLAQSTDHGLDQNEEEGRQSVNDAPGQPAEEPLGGSEAAPAAEPNGAEGDGNSGSKGGKDSQESLWSWIPPFKWNDTVAQWIMALFGVVATGISIWAVCLLRGTLDATERAAGAAEDAVQEARISTTRSIEEMRRSNQRELRAYMSLVPAGATYDPITETFTIYIVQKNNGATPAKNVTLSARLRFLAAPLLDNPLPRPVFRTSKNVVFPKQNFVTDHHAGERVNRDDLPKILDRCERLYFTGQIKYTDIFGVIRKTIVCWSYSIEGMADHIEKFTAWQEGHDARASKPAALDWDYAPRHNNAT